MNLSEQDDLLTASFADFTAEAGPAVRPQGVDAVRVTVAHRRRLLALAIGALAVAAIAIPIGTYAALGRSAHGPPQTPATAAPTVDESAEPNPGPSPVLAEGEPCAQRPTPTPPGDVVSALELCAASLALPRWQNTMCPTQVTLVTGHMFIAESVHLSLGTVVHADVDRDGAFETVAILSCGGEVRDQQVVAFRPGRSSGVETVAQVLANVPPIETISELEALATGNLRITVGDYGVIVGGDPTINQYQQRTFGWNGQRFVQVAGPTLFPPNPRLVDLTVLRPSSCSVPLPDPPALRASRSRPGTLARASARRAGCSGARVRGHGHGAWWVRHGVLPIRGLSSRSASSGRWGRTPRRSWSSRSGRPPMQTPLPRNSCRWSESRFPRRIRPP